MDLGLVLLGRSMNFASWGDTNNWSSCVALIVVCQYFSRCLETFLFTVIVAVVYFQDRLAASKMLRDRLQCGIFKTDCQFQSRLQCCMFEIVAVLWFQDKGAADS